MMSETALMVLELAGIALLIAGLPLAFLYFKKGMGLFQKLNWTIVFLTFDLILFGAFTRLGIVTGMSGLARLLWYIQSFSCN